MAVDLDHPLIAAYLTRLDAAGLAAGLPPGRRQELTDEIRGHLAEALPGSPGDVEVASAVERLGPVDDVIAAELSDRPAPSFRPWPGARATVDGAGPVPGGFAGPVPAGRGWTAPELAAVLGLTVGTVLIPVVGPLTGVVLAAGSGRWTRRRKILAAAVAIGPALAVAVLLLAGVVLPRAALAVFVAVVVAPLLAGTLLAVARPVDDPRAAPASGRSGVGPVLAVSLLVMALFWLVVVLLGGFLFMRSSGGAVSTPVPVTNVVESASPAG
jgi:hypothetical protein